MPIGDPHNLQRGRQRWQLSRGWRSSESHRLLCQVGDCVDLPWEWVLAFIPWPNCEIFIRFWGIFAAWNTTNKMISYTKHLNWTGGQHMRKRTQLINSALKTHGSWLNMHLPVRLGDVRGILHPSKALSVLFAPVIMPEWRNIWPATFTVHCVFLLTQFVMLKCIGHGINKKKKK